MKFEKLGSSGRFYQGDCLAVLPELLSESVELIFLDPPFNLSKVYGAGITDSLKEAEYLAWCNRWLDQCCRILKPGGALFLYNIPKWNLLLGASLAQTLQLRHWIAVDFKGSFPIHGKLYPAHYSLLYFTKGKPKTFSRPRIPIAACRHCGRDVRDYGGHRNKIHPEGINVSDIWTDISPVRHAKNKNRKANQLPEKLVQRVIEMASCPNDTVLDPFLGSGTTAHICEKLGRKWIGIELGDAQPIFSRLEQFTK